jgi:hypothetical protein
LIDISFIVFFSTLTLSGNQSFAKVFQSKELNMAQSPRSPKSPGAKFNYGNEDTSFWEKLGTLGRKKKIKEGK